MGNLHQQLVMLVVADLSGRSSARPLRDRDPITLDQRGVEPLLAALAPGLDLAVPDLLGGGGDLQLTLSFRRMADFSRAGVIAQLPALCHLEQLRLRLMADATPGPALDVDALLAPGPAAAREALADWWDRASMDPLDQPPRAEVAEALRALRAAAGPADTLLGHSSPGSRRLLADALVAAIDAQLRVIRGAESFRRLEATWSGLAHLSKAAGERVRLQLRVLDASRDDLLSDFDDNPEPANTDLCWWLERRWLDTPEEDPASVLVVDHAFSSGRTDLYLLRNLAAVSARCLLPLLAAFRPAEAGLEPPSPNSPRPSAPLLEPSSVGHLQWMALRRNPDTRWVSICGPGVPVESLHSPSAATEPVWLGGALGAALWALTPEERPLEPAQAPAPGLASLGLGYLYGATPPGGLRLATGAVYLDGPGDAPPGAFGALPSTFEVQLAASRVAQRLRVAARAAAGAPAAELEALVRAEAGRLQPPEAAGLPCARLTLEDLEFLPGVSPRELRARMTFAPDDRPEDSRRHVLECSLGALLEP